MIHIGIDFGTTNTVVSYELDGKFTVLNFDAHPFIPSLAAIVGNERYYGHEAAEYMGDRNALFFHSLKSSLHDYHDGKTLEADEQQFDLKQILVEFYANLKRQISAALPVEAGQEWDVIATVPANASSQQRWVTLEAMRAAELPVRALINEPTASGFEFAHYFLKGSRKKSAACHVLVYDLGGGTFDVSLLRIEENDYRVLGSIGRNRLGGNNFDQKLFVLACQQANVDRRKLNYRQRVAGLLEARALKESISLSRGFLQRNLVFDFENIGVPAGAAKVKSTEYYAHIRPDIEDTIDLVEKLFTLPAVVEAGVKRESVDYVYMVGGSSRLPYVIHSIAGVFPKSKIKVSDNSFASPSLGAAIYAANREIRLVEKFTRHFGVIRLAGGKEYFDPIFPKGTTLPEKAGEVTRLVRDYDPEFNIGHLKFLECSEIDEAQGPAGDVNTISEIKFPYEPGLENPETAEIKRENLQHVRVCEEYRCDEHGIISAKIVRLNDGFTMGYNLKAA